MRTLPTETAAPFSTWAFVRRYGPLRPGERIQIARFWMGREVYQAPLTHNMITLNAVVVWLTTPNLAWTFCCTAHPQPGRVRAL